jgi:hypothetical protein
MVFKTNGSFFIIVIMGILSKRAVRPAAEAEAQCAPLERQPVTTLWYVGWYLRACLKSKIFD